MRIPRLDGPIGRVGRLKSVVVLAVGIDHIHVARVRVSHIEVRLILAEYSCQQIELVAFDGDLVAVENEVVRRGDVVGLNDEVVENVVVNFVIDLQPIIQPARFDARRVGLELLRLDFIAEGGSVGQCVERSCLITGLDDAVQHHLRRKILFDADFPVEMIVGLVEFIWQASERYHFKAAGGSLGGTAAPAAGNPKRIGHAVGHLAERRIPLQAVGVDVGLIEAERQIGEQVFGAAVAGGEIREASKPLQRSLARAREPQFLRELVIVRGVGRLNGAQPIQGPRVEIQVRRQVAQRRALELIIDLSADRVRLVVVPLRRGGAEWRSIGSRTRVVPDIPIEITHLAIFAGRGIRALVDQILGVTVFLGALSPQVDRQSVDGIDDGRQAHAEIVLRVGARHFEAVVVGVVHRRTHGHALRRLDVLRDRDMHGRVVADLEHRFPVVVEPRFGGGEVDGAADGAAAVQGTLRSR